MRPADPALDVPRIPSLAAVTGPTRWNRDTLPEGDEKREAVRDMFDAIAPRYDLVNRIMTFRMDVRWRRTTVATLGLPAGEAMVASLVQAGFGDARDDLLSGGITQLLTGTRDG